jgi:hypothetical protein
VERDLDIPRGAVLTGVFERLFDDACERDRLGVRQLCEVTTHVQLHLSPRRPFEPGCERLDDVRQRVQEARSRLDRMRELTELAVDGRHPRLDVPDAAEDDVSMLGAVEQL